MPTRRRGHGALEVCRGRLCAANEGLIAHDRRKNLLDKLPGSAAGRRASAAVAELFARRGRDVAVADVPSSLGQAIFTPCDVTREDAVQASIEQAVEQFGGLQIVVNCAGVVHVAPLHEYSEHEWDQIMAVNVKSIFFSIKHGIAHLRKNRRSYVVNIGSISSFVGQAGTPAYTASKGAVLQLSRSIALDYAADGCAAIASVPRHHRHADAPLSPEQDARSGGGAPRAAEARADGRGPDAARHRQGRALPVLRRFLRRHRHVAGRRRRLPGRRRVEPHRHTHS